MDLNSIEIKLIKKGFDKFPSYIITIYGDGRVIFEGIKNVKQKGIFQTNLSKEKINDLFLSLKESGFFTISDNKIIDDSNKKPYSEILLKIRDEEDKIKTKKISFYDSDLQVSDKLGKNFELVERLTNAEKWIGNKIVDSRNKINVNKILNSNYKKILIPIFAIIIILIVLIYSFSTGLFLSPSSDDSNNTNDTIPSDNNNINVNNVTIDFLNTINKKTYEDIENIIESNNRPLTTKDFKIGDLVYIFYEYSNITHDNSYNIKVEISVLKDIDLIYNTTIFYLDEDDTNVSFNNLHSFIIEDSWITGQYQINLQIFDLISNKNNSKNAYLNIIQEDENIPTVTITANPINGYAPLIVDFNSSYSNFTVTPLTYQWDLGDGSSSLEENITHQYNEPGIFYVTLTVNDSNGLNASDTTTVRVKSHESTNNPINAQISEIDPMLEFYDTTIEIKFVGSATGGSGNYLFEWDFEYDSSFISDTSGKTVYHTYDNSNIYILTLRVTDIEDPLNQDTYKTTIFVS